MKFKAPIEIQAGISDGDPTNPLGQSGYLLSSDGSNVNWVSPGGLSAETAEAIVQPIKANEALVKGDPVYIVGFNNGQNTNIVAKADSSDPTKMPVVGLADDDYANQAFGTMTAFGSFNGDFDTTGPGTENWVIGDIIFVKAGGGLTNVKPTGTDLIQNIAIVSRVNSQTGELEVIALGRTNDVPNLPEGRLFVGTATNTSLTSDVIYVDDTNDRVGIGTANPSTDLEVSSTGANGIVISKTSNQAQVSGRLFFTNDTPTEGFALFNSSGTLQINSAAIPNDTSGNNKVSIVGSSGNVGIGASPPQEKLHVSGGGNVRLEVESTSSFVSALKLTNTAGSYASYVDSSGNLNTFDYVANSVRTTLLSNGNFGIGTTNPTEKLEVEDSGTLGVNKDVLSITNKLLSAPSVDTTVGMNFNLQQSSNSAITYGAIQVGEHAGTGSIKGSMRFLVQDFSGGFNLDEKMRIESNGNVGIGTDSPNRLLTVETTGNSSYLALNSSSNNTTIGSDVNGAFIVYDDSSATYRMVIDQTTGNIGVNTTNPYAKLHVASGNTSDVPTAGNATGGLFVSNTNKTYGVNIGVSGSGWSFIQSQRADGLTNLYSLNLQPLGGNVGIGTDSPNEKLEVAGSTRITGNALDVGYGNNGTNYVQVGRARTTNGYALIDLIGDDFYDDYGFRIIRNNSGQNTDTDILHRGTGDLDLKTIDAGDIGFHTTSVQRMIVKSSGNVGIGDSNPDAKLEIAGHSTSGKFLLIDGVAGGETFLDVEDGADATLFSITRETGNTIKFNSFNDFSFADNISVTGTVTATNFILSSDENLKDNIKEIDVKHTDVNWKNFELKSEPGIKRAGVIAQELEVKHPEFVRTASDGLKSVAYIDLLITKIAELEARLEKLEK